MGAKTEKVFYCDRCDKRVDSKEALVKVSVGADRVEICPACATGLKVALKIISVPQPQEPQNVDPPANPDHGAADGTGPATE